MTKNISRADDHRDCRNTFGGIIFPSDFNTGGRESNRTRGSQIAQRIISDRIFDDSCKKNMEIRSRQKEALSYAKTAVRS